MRGSDGKLLGRWNLGSEVRNSFTAEERRTTEPRGGIGGAGLRSCWCTGDEETVAAVSAVEVQAGQNADAGVRRQDSGS